METTNNLIRLFREPCSFFPKSNYGNSYNTGLCLFSDPTVRNGIIESIGDNFDIENILSQSSYDGFQNILDAYKNFYNFITSHCPGYLHIVNLLSQPSYFGKKSNRKNENIRLSPDLRLGTDSSLYDASKYR